MTTADLVLTVTNTNDSGAGSLRQAMLDANASGQTVYIDFAIGGSGVQTITPLSELPRMTTPVILDATTQNGYAGRIIPAILQPGQALDKYL